MRAPQTVEHRVAAVKTRSKAALNTAAKRGVNRHQTQRRRNSSRGFNEWWVQAAGLWAETVGSAFMSEADALLMSCLNKKLTVMRTAFAPGSEMSVHCLFLANVLFQKRVVVKMCR